MTYTYMSPGKYSVSVKLRSGKTRNILVKKRSTINASVRGGVSKTEWVAYNGSLYVSETGSTRDEALRKAKRALKSKGFL